MIDIFTVIFCVCCLRFWWWASSLLPTRSDPQRFRFCASWQAVGSLTFVSLGCLIFLSAFPSLLCRWACGLLFWFTYCQSVLLQGWPPFPAGVLSTNSDLLSASTLVDHCTFLGMVCLTLSKFLVLFYSFSVLQKSFPCLHTRLPAKSAGIWLFFSMTNNLEAVVFSLLLKAWPRIILFAFFVLSIFVCLFSRMDGWIGN